MNRINRIKFPPQVNTGSGKTQINWILELVVPLVK